MPFITEKNHRRLLKDAAKGREAQRVFEGKAQKIAGLIAGGLRNYKFEIPEGVTQDQHNKYMDQIGLLASSLESMPLISDKK